MRAALLSLLVFVVTDTASAHDALSLQGSDRPVEMLGSPGLWPGSIDAASVLPGGNSGVLGNKFYANLLGRWLTNDTYRFRQQIDEVVRALDSHQVYRPARAP